MVCIVWAVTGVGLCVRKAVFFFKFPYSFRITSGELHLLGTLVLPLIKNSDLTTMLDDRKEMKNVISLLRER